MANSSNSCNLLQPKWEIWIFIFLFWYKLVPDAEDILGVNRVWALSVSQFNCRHLKIGKRPVFTDSKNWEIQTGKNSWFFFCVCLLFILLTFLVSHPCKFILKTRHFSLNSLISPFTVFLFYFILPPPFLNFLYWKLISLQRQPLVEKRGRYWDISSLLLLKCSITN